jgi:glycosyltransferase involved in cell wall biosynthesis
MKIVIDGYWWHEGPRSNRMVLLEIVRHWTAQFPDDQLILVLPNARGRSRHPLPPADVKIVKSHLRLHPAINSIELPMIARRESADAILAFNFAAMSKRGVVLLHDVLFQTNPEWFTPIERAYCSAMPILARGARSVIATSATEQERIIANNPKLRRVVRCGLAVASSLADAEPQRPDLDLAADSFIVFVGRFNIRKNLEVTVRAIQESGVLSADFPLVLIGEPSGIPAGVSEFEQDIANKSIVIAQGLTEGELKWLYTNCRFLVCLSLDEGFGLPVVEAASFGAPVLASDIKVFRENLGSYPSFVRPTDSQAVAAAARRMVTTHRSSTRYVEQHSWRSVCENIRGEFDRLVTDSGR